jgi:branched-subunit amino acid ABC-type transport system permease component
MKTLILSFFVLTIFANLQAQNVLPYSKKDAYISTIPLITSFTVLQIKGNDMTYFERSTVAMSAMILSAGYSLLKTTETGKKIQNRIRMNRNKNINL